MRKVIAAVLALTMTASLCACGSSRYDSGGRDNGGSGSRYDSSGRDDGGSRRSFRHACQNRYAWYEYPDFHAGSV